MPRWECLSIQARFERHYIPEPNSGCWIWTGAVSENGYGIFAPIGTKTAKAHRVSYELKNGKIPNGRWVLHRCDTPACVNPEHLFLGNHQENMDDMVHKGRQSTTSVKRGVENGMSKLTDDVVYQIRDAVGKQRDIAKRFGIGKSLVSLIKRREIWSHLK